MPYDPRIVGSLSDQSTPSPFVPSDQTVTPDQPVPSGRWLTALAFAVVVVPFAYALLRLATSPSANLTLPDDLALIDLHVRRALAWKQQLGVFDHNNWNHPGPSYFYLQSFVYRVLGSSVSSLFVGATLLNACSAIACVAVVRRRTTPARALWAAMCVCALAAVLAAGGPSATTYSESVLGALVSPWNPMVVLFPLLLLVLLCAGAIDRSGVSLIGALVVATFVLQTNISAGPLALALVGAAGVVWVVTVVVDRRGSRSQTPDTPPSRLWGRVLAGVGLVALALMWLAPIVQQVTNHPGNITLIQRFFSNGHAGQSLDGALWAVSAGAAVFVFGPGEVMTSILGGVPMHAGLVVALSLATVVAAVVAVVVGARMRSRFALGLGVLVLVGSTASVVAVTHVVGFIFGYLAMWVVVLPVAALIGLGMAGAVLVRAPLARRSAGALTAARACLCVLAVLAGVVLCVRIAAIPPLDRASDPDVGRLATLVAPHLTPGVRVAVGDAGAGTADTQLLDTEEFIGLVNLLERSGYRPTVNDFWKAQFGPGYRTDGTEPRVVELSTWSAASPAMPGYVGKVGDMAVTVTDRVGAAAPISG